jgi:hypothetical protein
MKLDVFERRMLLIFGLGLFAVVVFWSVTIYVAVHFISKFW